MIPSGLFSDIHAHENAAGREFGMKELNICVKEKEAEPGGKCVV